MRADAVVKHHVVPDSAGSSLVATLRVTQTKADATVTVEHPIALDHNVLRLGGTPLPKVDRVLGDAGLTSWDPEVAEYVVPHDPVNALVDGNAACVIPIC